MNFMIIVRLRDYIRRERYIHRRIHKLFTDKDSGSKTKISIVTGQLAAGGVERVLLSILEGLPRDRFEVVVYITDFSNNVWIEKFKPLCTVIHVTKELDWSTDPQLIKNYLGSSIIKNRSDIVFITNSATGYSVLPRLNRSYLMRLRKLRVYDLLHTHGTPEENDAFLRISHPFDKFITRRIVISKYLKNYLCTHYPVRSSKVLTIYNGLLNSSALSLKERKAGTDFLKLGEKERAITYVGRLQSDKSPERLVELAASAKDLLSRNNAFIAVVGDGNLRQSLEDKSRKYGIYGSAVRFYGFTDHPTSVMSASYFTILTSNLEGIPMSVLESMDVATPVIAPAVGGIPEMIPESTGILVDFNNTPDESKRIANLKQALEYALSLETRKYAHIQSAAHDHIEKNFKHMKEDYIKLFEYGRIE